MDGYMCKGAFSLGTACGTCSRCEEQLSAWAASNPVGTPMRYSEYGNSAFSIDGKIVGAPTISPLNPGRLLVPFNFEKGTFVVDVANLVRIPAEVMPATPSTEVTCIGSLVFGTACGKCSKCEGELLAWIASHPIGTPMRFRGVDDSYIEGTIAGAAEMSLLVDGQVVVPFRLSVMNNNPAHGIGWACINNLTRIPEPAVSMHPTTSAGAIVEAGLAEEITRLKRVIEGDRSRVAEVVTGIRKAMTAHEWLRLGRGSYEYNDDRWKDEFGLAMDAIEEQRQRLAKIAADWGDSPMVQAEIQRARAEKPTVETPATAVRFMERMPGESREEFEARRASSTVTVELVSPPPADDDFKGRGHVVWHSSEDDGGPDVGIEIQIGPHDDLWLGEIPNKTFNEHELSKHFGPVNSGWFLVRYKGKSDTTVYARFADHCDARELADEFAMWIRDGALAKERGVKILEMTEHAGAHLGRAEKAEVDVARMKAALEKIEGWKLPETGSYWRPGEPIGFETQYGTNGVRDYIRLVAWHGLHGGEAPLDWASIKIESARNG